MGSKNKYHVVISEESARMLISHSRLLAQKSETAAMRLISEFEHKAKSLELFPERNPLLAYTVLPPGKYRKLLFADRYLLIYQIKDNIVYIDAVVDCRQDYIWLIQPL